MSNSSRRWQEYKEQGGDSFRGGNYNDACVAYQSALDELSSSNNNSGSRKDRALIQSNIIACYLKLEKLEAALQLSTNLVEENPRWAKGHVRLASTYSALHRSNDACNSLQRALQLDPTHPTARTMLAHELRRTRSTTTQDLPPAATTTIDDDDHDDNTASSSPGNYNNTSSSLVERIKYRWNQIISWYRSLHSDMQSLLLLFLALVALYVAFGGRFGLARDTSIHSPSPSTTTATRKTASQYLNHNDNNDYTTTTYTDHYGQWKRAKKQQQKQQSFFSSKTTSSSPSFHIPNLLDGSVFSMICLGAILYLCQKVGIQPFQAIMMINMMQGGRRHHGGGRFFGGGGGGGRMYNMIPRGRFRL